VELGIAKRAENEKFRAYECGGPKGGEDQIETVTFAREKKMGGDYAMGNGKV